MLVKSTASLWRDTSLPILMLRDSPQLGPSACTTDAQPSTFSRHSTAAPLVTSYDPGRAAMSEPIEPAAGGRRHAAFQAQLEEAHDEQQLGLLQEALASALEDVRRLELEAQQAAGAAEEARRGREAAQSASAGLKQALDASEAGAAALRQALAQAQGQLAAAAEQWGREREELQQGSLRLQAELDAARSSGRVQSERLAAEVEAAQAARAVAQQARGRVAELEVALADESMKAELEASKLGSVERQLIVAQRNAAELAEQLEAAQHMPDPASAAQLLSLQEENTSLKAQLQAAQERLAGFGIRLSRAALRSCDEGVWEESGGTNPTSATVSGCAGDQACGSCTAAEAGQVGSESEDSRGSASHTCSSSSGGGSSDKEGSVGLEVESSHLGSEEESDTEQEGCGSGSCPSTTDGLLHMIAEQQQRIEWLEGQVRSAEDHQTMSAAVAKQTIKSILGQLSRSEAAAVELQRVLSGRDAQLAQLEAQRQAEAEVRRQQCQQHEQQLSEAKAQAQVLGEEERQGVAAQLAAALEQQRSAGLAAAALQGQLAALQAQLAEERRGAQQQRQQALECQLALERAQDAVKAQHALEAAKAAASLQAAQEEVQRLRRKLAETETVAQAVIAKLEAKLAAREGTGQEVTAQLQARCAVAIRASKDACEALQAERELWSCVRATYVLRASKQKAVLEREVLLRRALSAWRQVVVAPALGRAAGVLEPEISLAAAKGGLASAGSNLAGQATLFVGEADVRPAGGAGMALPFRIPAIGLSAAGDAALPPRASMQPAPVAASAEEQARLGRPAGSGVGRAHPVQPQSSPAVPLQLPAARRRQGAAPGTSPAPTHAQQAQQGSPPVISAEASEWTTVSTEAAVELLYQAPKQQVPRQQQPAHLPTGLAAARAGKFAQALRAPLEAAASQPAGPAPPAGAQLRVAAGSPHGSVQARLKVPLLGKQGPGAAGRGPVQGLSDSDNRVPATAGASDLHHQRQQQQHSPGQQHRVRQVPRNAKQLMLTGDKSPAPWVPSSRHARILSSFHIPLSPTTKPRQPEGSRLRQNGERRGALKHVSAVACPGGSPAVAGKQPLQHMAAGAAKDVRQQGDARVRAQAAGAAHPSSTAASPRAQQAATELAAGDKGPAVNQQQLCTSAAATSEACVPEQREGSPGWAMTPDASLPQPRASLPTAYSLPSEVHTAPATAMPAALDTQLSGAADTNSEAALAGSCASTACCAVEAAGTSCTHRTISAANELGAAAEETSADHANQSVVVGPGACSGGVSSGGSFAQEQPACGSGSGSMPCCGEDLQGEGVVGGCPGQPGAAASRRGVLIRRVALSTPVVLRRPVVAEDSEGDGTFCS